nr:unnamed protein product [Digitaria exilis]
MMQSFLRVANREHAENQVGLTWVRQLHCLAFDMERCVEFVVNLDNSSRWGWLRRVLQTVCCRAPPLPLDLAVAEIKQPKARVEGVSQRHTRYISIRDAKKGVVTIMPPAVEPNAFYPSALLHMMCDVCEATGRQRGNMGNLQELIAREDDDLHVISVWGSTGGDLGTASILRKAYCDPKICREFKSRAWVKLMHPFNHDEFVKSLLAQFYATSHQADAGLDLWTRMKAEATEDNLMKAKLMMQRMREQRHEVKWVNFTISYNVVV